MLEGKDIIGQAQTGTGKTAALAFLFTAGESKVRSLRHWYFGPTRVGNSSAEMRRLAKFMHGIKILPYMEDRDIKANQIIKRRNSSDYWYTRSCYGSYEKKDNTP